MSGRACAKPWGRADHLGFEPPVRYCQNPRCDPIVRPHHFSAGHQNTFLFLRRCPKRSWQPPSCQPSCGASPHAPQVQSPIHRLCQALRLCHRPRAMRAEATKRGGWRTRWAIPKNFLAGLEVPDFAAVGPSERNWPDTVSPTVRTHGGTAKHPWRSFRPGGPDDCRCRQTPSTLRTSDPEPLGPGLHHLRHQPLLGARRLCGNRAHGESHP